MTSKNPASPYDPTAASSNSSRTAKWTEKFVRAGYTTKGLVFGTVGILALMAAFGIAQGKITGARGAIEQLAANTFGQFILVTIAVGLASFSVWRFLQAVMDSEDKGSDTKAIMQRAGLAISGLTYATLAYFTVQILLGGNSSGSGTEEKAATVMNIPGGKWVLGLVGLGMLGVAIYQSYRAFTASFKDHWKVQQMNRQQEIWATRLSRTGIFARAVSFGLIGYFLILAAVNTNPEAAKGLDGALSTFTGGPLELAWLVTIGIGFVCYGIYCVVNARYKQINVPRLS